MWREAWADMVNARFAEKGLNCRIDHRSYVDQGLDLIPTVHEGPQVRKMEKKGIRTEKGELNRWIKATNSMIRSLRSTIKSLKAWIAEVKEILNDPKEIYLVNLLSEAESMRNKTAMTYDRGRKKARQSNLKRFMEECNYLKAQGIFTLHDFEGHISSVSEKLDMKKNAMNEKQQRLKELQQLMEDAKSYKELKPIFMELKEEKYRFSKAKEAYKTAYDSELRRFYMVKRKLKEKGFEQEPFPLNAWKKRICRTFVRAGGRISGI